MSRTRRPGNRLSVLYALTIVSIAAAALVSLSAGVHTASGQAAPVVQDIGVGNGFPEGITFQIRAESDSPIVEIRLRYKILPDGTNARGVPEFDPAPALEAEFFLGQPDVQLPPGTVIDYYWELMDSDGDTTETPVGTFFYDDIRFQWSSVSDENVTIYFYSGGEGAATEMLGVAIESIAEMSALLRTTIPFPVQVWIYETTEDMRPALQQRSETYEEQITTAGVRVATNTVLVLGNASFDTLRHELTHVVTAQAGESALGTLPAWLDEGTAVYGQENPGGFRDAVESAIRSGDVLSVREVSSYPGDPRKVTLFYGEGWSLVSYLVETYGEEQFAELFAEIKAGKRIDSALEAVYGFDQDGLEDEWRDFHDLPARITRAPADPTKRPQLPGDPTGGGEDNPEPPATEDDDGGGTSTGLIAGLAVGMLLLAVAVALGGITIARRM